MNSINSIFGDISTETFLKEYWQKKPLLVRNAFPDFEPPVSADELAGLALEEDVESRLITQSTDGEKWELQHGPFAEEAFADLPDSHWTLLVQAVDHWVPQMSEIIEKFRFAPNWRLDDLMVSYAADGGGVGPHYDNYDVFLIQATGTRRWEYGGEFGEDSPRRDDVPVMILPEWAAEESFDLQPGDMLYLPPRLGHNGLAVGDDCMTYSVGFRAPSHQEMLTGFTRYLDQVTCAEDRYSDPELPLQDNPGEISPDAINKVHSILQSYIDNPELLSDWFGRYMTEPKYPDLAGMNSCDTQVEEVMEALQSEVTIYRNEGSRFAYHGESDGVSLFVDGQCHLCDPEQNALAKALCLDTVHDNIPATSANAELINALLRQGALYVEDTED